MAALAFCVFRGKRFRQPPRKSCSVCLQLLNSVRSSFVFCDTPLSLILQTAIFLFFAGILGGALNAVAGGGSFIAFPALMFSGVPPIQANATNAVALWVGVTASSGAYRKHLDISRRVMIPLAVTSVIGGIVGAFLLLR